LSPTPQLLVGAAEPDSVQVPIAQLPAGVCRSSVVGAAVVAVGVAVAVVAVRPAQCRDALVRCAAGAAGARGSRRPARRRRRASAAPSYRRTARPGTAMSTDRRRRREGEPGRCRRAVRSRSRNGAARPAEAGAHGARLVRRAERILTAGALVVVPHSPVSATVPTHAVFMQASVQGNSRHDLGRSAVVGRDQRAQTAVHDVAIEADAVGLDSRSRASRPPRSHERCTSV